MTTCTGPSRACSRGTLQSADGGRSGHCPDSGRGGPPLARRAGTRCARNEAKNHEQASPCHIAGCPRWPLALLGSVQAIPSWSESESAEAVTDWQRPPAGGQTLSLAHGASLLQAMALATPRARATPATPALTIWPSVRQHARSARALRHPAIERDRRG